MKARFLFRAVILAAHAAGVWLGTGRPDPRFAGGNAPSPRARAVASGPEYAGCKFDGSEVTITFTQADGGLRAAGGELQGFVICGEDREWKPALVKIDGEKIIVSTPDGANAAAVRYAWARDAERNLMNGAGLPASPFRTDDWPLPPAP